MRLLTGSMQGQALQANQIVPTQMVILFSLDSFCLKLNLMQLIVCVLVIIQQAKTVIFVFIFLALVVAIV
ncbi:MAG: hypothetical protein RMM16_05605 [Chloroherpetonaceae bacterium]|nr:hypothetical protein [Chloroherpetonaceae bacterium]